MAIYKLKDITSIKRGSSPRPIQEWLKPEGLRWAKISDLEGNKINKTIQFIDNKYEEKALLGKFGDLFITNSASPGIPFIQFSKDKIAYHDGFIKIIPNELKIIKKFLLYKLIAERPKIVSMGSGSIFVNLKAEILREYKIDIPQINEQQKIIDIIEPIEILETNLELVNNKLNSLIKNLEVKDQRVKIDDISKLIRYKEKGIKQISAKKLNTSNPLIIEDEPIGTYKTNSFNCPEGTLVINTIRTYLRKFGILDDEFDANGTLAQLIIDKEFETTILNSLLNDDFWNETTLLSQGTKMPVIKKNDLLNIEIPLVKNEIEGLFNLFIKISLMKRKLSKLKNGLIQILIK